MADTDIRSWLKENGHEVPGRGPVPNRLRDVYDAGNPVFDADPPPPEEVSPSVPETAPASAPASGWQRATAKRKERSGPRRRRRVSTENLGASAWSVLGYLTGQAGNTPVARMIGLQAPVAGVIVEEAVKNTPVDRLLQPLARTGEAGKNLGVLFGPPVLVFAMTQNPQLFNTLYPMLKLSIVELYRTAAPILKKKQAEQEKLLEDLTDSEGNPIDFDGIIAALFAGGVPGEQSSE